MEGNGKFCVILGAGESGVGAAILALKKGWKVMVSDFGTIADTYKQELIDRGIDWEENTHTLSVLMNADLVIKSPGIP